MQVNMSCHTMPWSAIASSCFFNSTRPAPWLCHELTMAQPNLTANPACTFTSPSRVYFGFSGDTLAGTSFSSFTCNRIKAEWQQTACWWNQTPRQEQETFTHIKMPRKQERCWYCVAACPSVQERQHQSGKAWDPNGSNFQGAVSDKSSSQPLRLRCHTGNSRHESIHWALPDTLAWTELQKNNDLKWLESEKKYLRPTRPAVLE